MSRPWDKVERYGKNKTVRVRMYTSSVGRAISRTKVER